MYLSNGANTGNFHPNTTEPFTGTPIPFVAVTPGVPIGNNGFESDTIKERFQTITMMDIYSHKSPEELRLEDYMNANLGNRTLPSPLPPPAEMACGHEQKLKEAAERIRELEKQLEEALNARLCQICFVQPRDCIIMPCAHLLYCRACIVEHKRRGYNRCPTCRGPISGEILCNINLSS